ncbi:hypothetical protein FRC03_004399 [Tulasnella sp. 419]|nr:hypothetical protein FRC03_004399 [Tulasnella sp. 419]
MEWFEKRVNLLRSLFADLDYGYVLRNSSLKQIRDLCFEKVCNAVVNHPECVARTTKGIEEWVKAERNSTLFHPSATEDVVMTDVKGDFSHRDTVRRLSKFLTTVSLYESHLLEPYVRATVSYYTAETRLLAPKLAATKYFTHCDTRLKEEEDRVRDTLHESSLADVLHATESALLSEEVLKSLAKQATAQLITQRDVNALGRLYHLHERVNKLIILEAAFRVEVQNTIQKIVTDTANDDNMIPILLQEKAFLDKALVEAFHERPFTNTTVGAADNNETENGRPFAHATRTAFERGFAARKRKPAEMIAKYIDTAMRKGQREESEDDFWKELDAVLGLYRFTPDKDVFRTFYERALARRLLMAKSASDDFEKEVIRRLKEGYDPEFGKGEEKFKDLALSKDLMEEYKHQLARSHSGIKSENLTMSAMVLQYSSWPFKKWKGKVHLPTDMQNSIVGFETFYKKKHQRHVLDWNHSLGSAVLTARFNDGEGNGTEIKELSVSLLQAVVVLLFNEEDEWTFSSIQERTGIETKDLQSTLQSLACGKIRVLTKKPLGKDVAETDSFVFNFKFKSPKRKIHIPGIQQREIIEEQKETERVIDQDRTAFIDAAIVRIMKGAKKLHHEELKARTIDALKAHFIPSVTDIKRQIEKLVEKDYLERDEKDKGVFHYVS